MEIGAPFNAKHVTHVGFDPATGEFSGLPREWQILLQHSGISKKEQYQNPQAVLDAIGFYQETREHDDQVYHKMEKALAKQMQHGQQYHSLTTEYPDNELNTPISSSISGNDDHDHQQKQHQQQQQAKLAQSEPAQNSRYGENVRSKPRSPECH